MRRSAYFACAVLLSTLVTGACADGLAELALPLDSVDEGGVQDAAAEQPQGDKFPRLVQDVTLSEVAVFQAVKIPLATDGQTLADRNSPIVAGRKAVVRAYVKRAAEWIPREITAELKWEWDGKEAWQFDKRQPNSDSVEGSRETLFQFEVPAEQVVEGARLSVRLVSPENSPVEDGVQSQARWPQDGTSADLGAQNDGIGLKLVLIPMEYYVDSSGRLPDTSEPQLALFKNLLTALYPLVHVDITVHDPVPYDPGGTEMDFDALNEQLVELKDTDGAAEETYYFALVNPADSFDDYCSYSCITGQSFVVTKAWDGSHRVGAGVGFTGAEAAITLVHELGHNHGRGHAPCDVSDADPFPYAGGKIGVWGYDPRTGKFVDPKKFADFMGYCTPIWTSDFTYKALFERTLAVSKSVRRTPWPGQWQFLRSDAEGALAWGRTVVLSSRPQGETGEVKFLDKHGATLAIAEAPVVQVSRGGKRSWLVPRPPEGTRQVEVTTEVKGVQRIDLE